jgi:hypothetical protein
VYLAALSVAWVKGNVRLFPSCFLITQLHYAGYYFPRFTVNSFPRLRTLDIFDSPVIESGILSQHPQNTVQVHSIHAALNYLMFSVCV